MEPAGVVEFRIRFRAMPDKRRFSRIFFLLVAVGLVGLVRVTTSPAFETMRAVDVVQLIGTGMCFGAGIMALVLSRRSPSS
jgi:hypothetical protein